MFKPRQKPRIFAVPLGADFPVELVKGFHNRTADMPPHEQARADILLSTRRMERRVRTLFEDRGPALIPSLRLITDLAHTPGLSDLPQPESPLVQRLELRQLVNALLDAEPDLAPKSSAFDLADSLASLMEEMHGEGVSPEAFNEIDVKDHSEHWRRSLRFLKIIEEFFDATRRPSVEARQRSVVDALISRWELDPPQHPIIIAGSTGSRGTTARLMRAVSNLPQGAVILPGFDRQTPSDVTRVMTSEDGSEEHPQYRLAQFVASTGLDVSEVLDWSDTAAESVDRTRLVSLAFRPAPVTDAWLQEGPKLTELDRATSGVSLVEADGEQEEAQVIALALRRALDQQKSVALITPDRRLARRVAAALQVWKIEPDDSGGVPLQHTPVGRLLRQTAELLGRLPSPEALIGLLKHPLVSLEERGNHLLQTRDCELDLLRDGPREVTPDLLRAWAAKSNRTSPDAAWLDWLCQTLTDLSQTSASTLQDWVDCHIGRIERLCAGAVAGDMTALWTSTDGEAALAVLADLRAASDAAGQIGFRDYLQILNTALAGAEVRNPIAPHPDVMIWGTLEARVQGADVVVLSGLNEGTWPETPSPDPWLNRAMRAQIGLFSPERQIGLSAHDFQQGIMAPEVILTRSRRDTEAESVPSRWLNRLTSLLRGLPETGVPALEQMTGRGQDLLRTARAFSTPPATVPAATRPAPIPPVETRPTSLYVTRIETLIRDPYAIYARHILGLRPLDPLVPEPSAALRGSIYHAILERFVKDTAKGDPDLPTLLRIADEVLDTQVSWTAVRALWKARFRKVADWIIETEHLRRLRGQPTLFEEDGAADLPHIQFTLKGRADRVDVGHGGDVHIYDYKTGQLPTKKQLEFFNKQIPLLAAIAAKGGFSELGERDIAGAGFIGLGAAPKEVCAPYPADVIAEIWADLGKLIAAYRDPDKGYAARRAVFESRWDQDYDHLARFGEWDETDWPNAQKVGP